jgi:hypothetical protein
MNQQYYDQIKKAAFDDELQKISTVSVAGSRAGLKRSFTIKSSTKKPTSSLELLRNSPSAFHYGKYK